MDFHGNINLKNNEMQKLVFQLETSFPTDAVVGTIVFKDKILYMAVAVGNDSSLVWIPLTESINTFVHDQTSASTTWTVTHNLGINNPVVQIYDSNHELIIPNDVSISTNLELVVTLNSAITGRAIVMGGDTVPANGIGIIEPIVVDFNYNISGGTFASKEFLPSQGGTSSGMTFKPDGTKMYLEIISGFLFQYTLSTAWDVSTASYDNKSFDVRGLTGGQTISVDFSPAGNKLFIANVINGTGGWIQEFNLSTPWDISTRIVGGSFMTNSQSSFPTGISIKPDGTKMFVVGQDPNDRLYEYSLSIPFDVTSMTYTGNAFTLVQTGTGSGAEIYVNTLGTTLIISDFSLDKIFQYSLSTAWDLSTITYDNIELATSPATIAKGIHVGNGGNSLYINDQGAHKVFQYNI